MPAERGRREHASPKPSMPGRLLHTTLALALGSFPALGLLLVGLLGPFGGGGWAVLLVASIAGAALVVALAHRRAWSELFAPRQRGADDGPAGGATRWLVRALPVLALLPVAVAVLGSVRIQISHHGFFHSAYVYRVLAGDVPPENVTLAGHPSNTYWPYHALLAAVVELLDVPAPLASALLNLALLAGTLAWAAVLVRELYGRPPWPGGAGPLALVAVFGANLLGSVYWLARVAAGLPTGPRGLVLLGDVRLGSLVAKFANYTGASLGVYFFVLGLLVMVRLLRGRARGFDLVLGVVALIGAFALHAITGAFMVVAFAPAAILAWLGTAPREAGGLAAAAHVLRAAATALVATPRVRRETSAAVLTLLALGLPVLAFVATASSEFPAPPRLGLPDAYALSIVAVAWPLLPFFVAGVVAAARARDASGLFLALVCLGGYALASVLSISGRNEYKFIYLGSIGLSLVALAPITSLLRTRATGARRVARGAALATLVLACANVALFGLGLLRGASFRDRTFRYEGRHVVAEAPRFVRPGTGLEYGDLFAWIRGHTAPDAVVVVPLLERDKSVLYVLSERVPYAVDGLHYNRGLPDYGRRVALLDALYAPASSADERGVALAAIRASLPERPMVVLLPRRIAAAFDPTTLGLVRLEEGRAASLFAFPDPPPVRGAS